MVYLHVTVQLERGKIGEYEAHFAKLVPLLEKRGQHMVGAWRATYGVYDEALDMFVFDSLAEMERIRRDLGDRFCRRCEYCEPCPQGVRTSMLVNAPKLWKRLPASRVIEMLSQSVQWAVDNCTKCGECESKCPYGLPIREMLDESIALYSHERAKHDAMSTLK